MVRMIPWSLPPVKGGSIGGYTPKVDPTPPTPDPEPKSVYYDFSNANFSGNCSCKFNATAFTANTPKEVNCTGVAGTFAFTDITAIDLIGVASLSLKIQAQSEYNGEIVETDNYVLSLDPVSYVPTFVSGTATVTKPLSTTYSAALMFGEISTITSLIFTFYVYNGNGEIVQQEEVTVVGGE